MAFFEPLRRDFPRGGAAGVAKGRRMSCQRLGQRGGVDQALRKEDQSEIGSHRLRFVVHRPREGFGVGVVGGQCRQAAGIACPRAEQGFLPSPPADRFRAGGFSIVVADRCFGKRIGGGVRGARDRKYNIRPKGPIAFSRRGNTEALPKRYSWLE